MSVWTIGRSTRVANPPRSSWSSAGLASVKLLPPEGDVKIWHAVPLFRGGRPTQKMMSSGPSARDLRCTLDRRLEELGGELGDADARLRGARLPAQPSGGAKKSLLVDAVTRFLRGTYFLKSIRDEQCS